jgi:hypothetical protein
MPPRKLVAGLSYSIHLNHPALSLSLDAGDALTSTFLSQALAAVRLQLYWKPSIIINVSFLLSPTPGISFKLEFQSTFNSFTPTAAMDDGGWIASTQQQILPILVAENPGDSLSIEPIQSPHHTDQFVSSSKNIWA